MSKRNHVVGRTAVIGLIAAAGSLVAVTVSATPSNGIPATTPPIVNPTLPESGAQLCDRLSSLGDEIQQAVNESLSEAQHRLAVDPAVTGPREGPRLQDGQKMLDDGQKLIGDAFSKSHVAFKDACNTHLVREPGSLMRETER
jgi:hypothetical protein